MGQIKNGPFQWHWLISILAGTSNYNGCKVFGVIVYPFGNVNGAYDAFYFVLDSYVVRRIGTIPI